MTCNKCNGTGWYQYSTRGTPHFTVCDLCCKHDQGRWLLTEHYTHSGKWCCKAGCGKTWDTEFDEGKQKGSTSKPKGPCSDAGAVPAFSTLFQTTKNMITRAFPCFKSLRP